MRCVPFFLFLRLASVLIAYIRFRAPLRLVAVAKIDGPSSLDWLKVCPYREVFSRSWVPILG